jgi:hypothetical protein
MSSSFSVITQTSSPVETTESFHLTLRLRQNFPSHTPASSSALPLPEYEEDEGRESRQAFDHFGTTLRVTALVEELHASPLLSPEARDEVVKWASSFFKVDPDAPEPEVTDIVVLLIAVIRPLFLERLSLKERDQAVQWELEIEEILKQCLPGIEPAAFINQCDRLMRAGEIVRSDCEKGEAVAAVYKSTMASTANATHAEIERKFNVLKAHLITVNKTRKANDKTEEIEAKIQRINQLAVETKVEAREIKKLGAAIKTQSASYHQSLNNCKDALQRFA